MAERIFENPHELCVAEVKRRLDLGAKVQEWLVPREAGAISYYIIINQSDLPDDQIKEALSLERMVL